MMTRYKETHTYSYKYFSALEANLDNNKNDYKVLIATVKKGSKSIVFIEEWTI